MTTPTPRRASSDGQAPDLAKVRERIDAVDRALLDLIAQRLALSADVRRAKAGAKLWRPAREDSHVGDLAAAAVDTQTPTALVSRIWAELMSASISVQGATRLHIALEGDAAANLSLVRDRFGGSLPVLSYPTSSAALAAAYSDPEGIAVLPAPGGMTAWWTALMEGGAMADMKIVARLPRIGGADWPSAVAVAVVDLDATGSALIAGRREDMAGLSGVVRAESGDFVLMETPEPPSPLGAASLIGYLPPPIR